jgi:hypothetical protein
MIDHGSRSTWSLDPSRSGFQVLVFYQVAQLRLQSQPGPILGPLTLGLGLGLSLSIGGKHLTKSTIGKVHYNFFLTLPENN